MKLLKSRKIEARNLTKFLIIFTIVFGGVFSFQYFAKAITITNITPDSGSVVGGQEVTITGDFTFTPTTLQQITQDYCTNEMSVFPTADTKPDTITLTDTRNGQEYRVRKLADGNCWMIDNLKLELTDGMKLTPDTTNVKVETTVNLATGGRDGNFTTQNYLTADNTNAAGTDYDNYNAWRQVDPNETPNCQNNTGTGGKAYNDDSTTGCGYLYNFYTATASTGDNTKTAQYDTAESSICPAGWRLPTGMRSDTGTEADFGDFQKLDVEYGGTGARQTGGPQVLTDLWLSAGTWQGAFGGGYASALLQQGAYGLYWSASVNSGQRAHVTQFYASGIDPSVLSDFRMHGFAVRCIIDENHTPTPVVPVVTIGGKLAQITAWSETSITFVAPAHSAGKVDVIITRGSQMFTISNAYEYFNVPDVPNTGAAKTSATTTVVQSGLAALIIIAIATVTFVIKHKKTKQR